MIDLALKSFSEIQITIEEDSSGFEIKVQIQSCRTKAKMAYPSTNGKMFLEKWKSRIYGNFYGGVSFSF